MPLVLETKGLAKNFGGIVATDNVSLAVEKGARHALIGPNGAGKTTIINLLTGVLRPTAGSIRLDGLRALYDPRLVRDFRLFSAEHGRLEEVFTQPAP